MKTRILLPLTALALVGSAPKGDAQTGPVELPDLSGTRPGASPANLNRISVSYRMGLNISADFRKLGGFERIGNPGPPTGSTADRTYENGYNKVDISGNAEGVTWNWGYDKPSSVAGDTLVLQSSTSPNNQMVDDYKDGIQHGFEITYSRELTRGRNGRFGVEVGFGYTPLRMDNSEVLQARVNRLVDTYSLGGVIPPLAPYHGTFEGPGPLIDASPTRNTTIISQAATIRGTRKLESDVFIVRLGPYLEVPLKGRFSAIFSGGLNLVHATSDFSYTESVSIADVGTQTRSGSGEGEEWLVGGYVGGVLACAVAEDISVFAGAYYQSAGRSPTDLTGSNAKPMSRKEAILDMGESLVISIGASYSF